MKDILTPIEAGEYLNVDVKTIYRLIKEAKIPGRKVGGRWRFKKPALDEWLLGRTNYPLKESIGKLHAAHETWRRGEWWRIEL